MFPRRKVRAPVLRCEIISSRASYEAKYVRRPRRINKETKKKRHPLHRTHSTLRLYTISDGRAEVKKIMTVKKRARIVPDWQTADPTAVVFSRIRENGLHGETKGTRLKGTQLRLNSVDPAQCSPTPAGPEAPFESSPSLLPLARSHLTTPSRRSQPPTSPRLPLVFSLGRVLRETLFGPFDSLILSSLFPLLHLLLSIRCRGTRSTGVWRTY